MIDTLAIYTKLSKEEYNIICQAMNLTPKFNLKSQYTGNKDAKLYTTRYLVAKGFLKINLWSILQDNGYRYRELEIILKPKLLIDQKNYSDVTKASELKTIKNKFNKLIKEISSMLPEFGDWKCRRIDYAITIQTKYVEEYIKLFKMGNVWKDFLGTVEFYDQPGSLYLKSSSNDIGINFYDKYDQLTNTEYALGKEDGYEEAKNKLRLEVQCCLQKVRNIKHKHNLNTTTVEDLLQPFIAEDIIKNYCKMVSDKQDYYSFEKARQILDANKLKYPVEQYLEVLRDIKKYGSIWKAAPRYRLGRGVFENRVSEIRKLEVNPVTIPDEWGYHHLSNLYPQIIVI